METGFLVLNEKDWQGMNPEQRAWAVFNTLCSMDVRLKRIEQRPLIDKCYSFLGGVFGGIIATFGIKWGGLTK